MSSILIPPSSPTQMQEDLLLNPPKGSSTSQTLECFEETSPKVQETPQTTAELIALAKQSESETALKIYNFALSQNPSKFDQFHILVRKVELIKKTNSAEAMKDLCEIEALTNELFKGNLNDEITAHIFYDRAKICSDQQLSLKYYTEATAAFIRLNDVKNAQICLCKINNIQKNNSQRS